MGQGALAPVSPRRLWALAIGLAALSAIVFVAFVVPLAAYDEDELPWLVFVVAYGLAGAATARVSTRGVVIALGMFELPLIVGFYYSRPADLVLSQLAGMAIALVLVRRLRARDVVFSIAAATLATSLAFLAFLTLAPPGLEEVLEWWLASFAGASASVVVGVATAAAAAAVSGGRPWPTSVLLGLAIGIGTAVAGTSVALLVVVFIHNHPDDLWLVLVPAVVAGVGNIVLAAQRERQARIEFLYDCARTLQRSLVDPEMLAELLARSRVMFQADVAEILLASSGSTPAARVAIGPDGEVPSVGGDAEALLGEWLALLAPGERGRILGGRQPGAGAASPAAAALGDAVIVPLRNGPDTRGVLLVANRSPHAGAFTREDLRLLETLAAQIGAALENSTLVDRLAESLANVTQLAAAVESSDDAILALSTDGAISAWNPAAERLFGYPAAELAGLEATALAPLDRQAEAALAFRGTVAGEAQHRGVTEIQRPDGSRVPVSVTVSPITDRAGTLVGLSTIVHDETARNAADAALRQSVEQFRRVFRDGPIGMALVDEDRRWSAVNDALCRILESSEEELVGQRFDTLVHEDDAEGAVRMMDEMLADDTSSGFSTERRFVTRTGRDVWTRVTSRPLLDDLTGAARVITMIEDVTESRLDAQRVRDTEARLHRAVAAFTAVREPASVFRAVLAAARDLLDAEFAAIGVLAEDGETIANFHFDGIDAATVAAIGLEPTGRGLLGRVDVGSGATRVRDVGSHPAAIGVPPGHPPVTSFIAVPIVFEGRLVARLYAGNKRSGAEFHEDDEGVATALAAQAAVVLENARISAHTMELVSELDRANAGLRKANDAKSEFLGTVSHELRTPLHSILVAAELVHDPSYGPLTETRARELGATIQGSARHLVLLIDDLVDLSRIEADRLEIRPVEVDLARLLEEVRHEMAPIASNKGIPLQVQCDQDLRIDADPLRLRQVLVNLVANAIKFSAEMAIVRIEAARTAGGVEVHVHDTGPGILPDDLARIFEPFERGAGTHAPGAGLGLAIARRLVDLHGGRLDVTSRVGAGSTFTVTLPGLGGGPRAADAVPAPAPGMTKGRAGDTVLVVEDDATALGLVSDVLERSGYAVWGASSLEEAHVRLEEETPSLVLVDLRLGSDDGLELVRLLRADPRTQSLPILALSANAMQRDVERAIDAGCDGHLAKPVIMRDLLERIGDLLAKAPRGQGSPHATSVGGRGA